MVMTKEERQQTVGNYRTHEKDTGSPDVQIALLTERITYMTSHMKVHPKDFHSRYGLQGMVNRRNKLLKYVRREYPDRYKDLIARLGLRK
jgi:small subunit ribosomal protein S15